MIKIELDHDIELNLTFFKNEREGKPIGHVKRTFGQLVEFLSKPKIGPKNSNAAIVGGEVVRWRNNENTKNRSIITIDIDDMPLDVDLYSQVSSRFNRAFVIYSTHNHTPDNKRYRLFIPLDKAYELTPETYRAAVRYICRDILDIDYYDEFSEVLSQVMYLPTSETPEYYEMHYQDEEVFKLSDILDRLNVVPAAEIPAKSNQYWVDILQGVSEGGRDVTATKLIGHLLRRYVDPHVAYVLLECWNERNSPPLGQKDLQRIYKSILKSELNRRGGK